MKLLKTYIVKHLIVVGLLIAGFANAQITREPTACDDIKSMKLEFLTDGSLSSPEVLEEKMGLLTNCGLDDYDVTFFSSMSTMSLILKRLTATTAIENLTFADLLSQIQLMKKKENYQSIKKFTIISEDLGDRVGTESTWETDREIFYELKASQRIIDAVAFYLKENPNNQKTYREILELINQ
jgi:hypothetical protein